ncbi:MAG: hypothetical protein AAFY15_07545 [Cyanobacteria bacterium J06648_11]
MSMSLRSLAAFKWLFLAAALVTLAACEPSSTDTTDSPDAPFDAPAESLPSE